MRILIQDYGGYPFPLQLSEALSLRGHVVVHLHFADLQKVKAGAMAGSFVNGNLTVVGLSLGEPFQKYNLFRRRQQELCYAELAQDEIRTRGPEVVLSAGAPLEVQSRLAAAAQAAGAEFYFWMQDVNSAAVQKLLPKRLPIVGHLYGWYQEYLERRLAKNSSGLVFITKDFLKLVELWGLSRERCHVIENWAPLETIAPDGAAQRWAAKHGLQGKRLLLYSGTLGMKHNPGLLLKLAEGLATTHSDAQVVVVSFGPGVDYLQKESAARGLRNLTTLGFQPIEEFPHMLGAATVLLAILESSASEYSVPSKVLSYLCAARPIVLSVPLDNLASRIVMEHQAGLAAEPTDEAGFVAAAQQLLDDPEMQRRCAWNGRQYAEKTFDIQVIADRFEAVFGLQKEQRAKGFSAAG